jgi:hypothetical protein
MSGPETLNGKTSSNGRVLAEHDLLPRQRDGRGNRMPDQSAYEPPASGQVALNDSQLNRVLELVSSAYPAQAAWLAHYYDERVRPSYDRVVKVRLEEEQAFHLRRERCQAHNEEVERQIEVLVQRGELRTMAEREAYQQAKQELADAHANAARRMAALGMPYDPEAPNDEGLVKVHPTSKQEGAARLGLPYYEKEHRWHALPFLITMLFTLIVGGIIGISIGTLAGLLTPDNLDEAVPQMIGCIAVGVGIALFSRYAVVLGFKLAAESTCLEHRRSVRGWWYAMAFAVLALIFTADVFTERWGILKFVKGTQITVGSNVQRNETAEWVFYLVAAVILLGYLLYSAYEGFIKGRSKVVDNRLEQHIGEEAHRREAEARSTPTIQEALAAVALVREHKRRYMEAKESFETAVKPFQTEEERLRAMLQEVPLDLDQSQKERIQDSLDNWQGAQKLFDQRIEPLVRACDTVTILQSGGTLPPPPPPEPRWEARPSFLDRVRELFGGGSGRRPSRRTSSRQSGPYVS